MISQRSLRIRISRAPLLLSPPRLLVYYVGYRRVRVGYPQHPRRQWLTTSPLPPSLSPGVDDLRQEFLSAARAFVSIYHSPTRSFVRRGRTALLLVGQARSLARHRGLMMRPAGDVLLYNTISLCNFIMKVLRRSWFCFQECFTEILILFSSSRFKKKKNKAFETIPSVNVEVNVSIAT